VLEEEEEKEKGVMAVTVVLICPKYTMGNMS